jgi:hypothetical protein
MTVRILFILSIKTKNDPNKGLQLVGTVNRIVQGLLSVKHRRTGAAPEEILRTPIQLPTTHYFVPVLIRRVYERFLNSPKDQGHSQCCLLY